MDKRITKLQDNIKKSSNDFYYHLRNILGSEVTQIVDHLACQTQVFIFSGIIRDYFLKENSVRDVDLVLEKKIDIENLLTENHFIKNSFGGYKVAFETISLDVWFLQDTWAYKNEKVFDFYFAVGIPYTAFFNASAIVYDYNNREFYFTKKFLQFLRDKELNIMYEPNPNYDLCIINTLNYKNKYKVRISKKLSNLVIDLHNRRQHEYNQVQQRHFGRIIYTESDIQSFINELEKGLHQKKRSVSKEPKAKEFNFNSN